MATKFTDDQIQALADAVDAESRLFYQTWFKFDDYGQPLFTITLRDDQDSMVVKYAVTVNVARQITEKRDLLGHWPNLAEYLDAVLTAETVFEIGRKEMVAFINHDESYDYHDHSEDYGRASFGATFEIGMYF